MSRALRMLYRGCDVVLAAAVAVRDCGCCCCCVGRLVAQFLLQVVFPQHGCWHPWAQSPSLWFDSCPGTSSVTAGEPGSKSSALWVLNCLLPLKGLNASHATPLNPKP